MIKSTIRLQNKIIHCRKPATVSVCLRKLGTFLRNLETLMTQRGVHEKGPKNAVSSLSELLVQILPVSYSGL